MQNDECVANSDIVELLCEKTSCVFSVEAGFSVSIDNLDLKAGVTVKILVIDQ